MGSGWGTIVQLRFVGGNPLRPEVVHPCLHAMARLVLVRVVDLVTAQLVVGLITGMG